MATKREQDAALLAVNRWLRLIHTRGVTLDPVLTVALVDTARAVDRARATDETGNRLAYIARELRAARLDVLALIPSDVHADPFTRLLTELQMADATKSGASN
jgi:hypothetical protein